MRSALVMAQGNEKPLSRGWWWLVFAVASYILSLCFQTFKTFTLAPTLANGLAWGGMLLLLGLVMMVLSYDAYVSERNKGKIHHPVRLFEWIYRKQYPHGETLFTGKKGDPTP